MNSGAWVTFSSGSSANEMVLCPHLVWDVPPQLASVEPPPPTHTDGSRAKSRCCQVDNPYKLSPSPTDQAPGVADRQLHTHVEFCAPEVSGVFPGERPPELNLSQVPTDSFSHLLGHEFSNVPLNYSPGAH